jgi:hypothetical protein
MAIDLSSIPTEQLKRAIELREQLDALQQQLSQIGSAPAKRGPGRPPGKAKPPGKRVMTDEWRAKIAAAQRRRWAKRAKQKSQAAAPAEKPKARRKRTMTPAALAALARAREIRWAKVRQAKAK